MPPQATCTCWLTRDSGQRSITKQADIERHVNRMSFKWTKKNKQRRETDYLVFKLQLNAMFISNINSKQDNQQKNHFNYKDIFQEKNKPMS